MIIKTFSTIGGQILTKEDDIQEAIKSEFGEKFKQGAINVHKLQEHLDLISSEISDLDNMELTKQVSKNEIKMAVFDLGGEKSPGPDGMPAGFYQKYWHIVGPSVTTVVKDFLEVEGCLNK